MAPALLHVILPTSAPLLLVLTLGLAALDFWLRKTVQFGCYSLPMALAEAEGSLAVPRMTIQFFAAAVSGDRSMPHRAPERCGGRGVLSGDGGHAGGILHHHGSGLKGTGGVVVSILVKPLAFEKSN